MHAGTDPSRPGPEARLDELLADCLDAIRRGAAIDREAIAAAHPEDADELIAFLADQERLHRIAERLREAEGPTPDLGTDGPTPTPTPPEAMGAGRIVGDYEILGVLGWGGMGIV